MEIKSLFRYRAIRFDGYKEEFFLLVAKDLNVDINAKFYVKRGKISPFFFHDRSIDR